MTSPRRLLARMSASAQSLDPSYGTSPAALRPADIALAVGRIEDNLTYLWLVYRYGGHDTPTDMRRLEESILLELRGLSADWYSRAPRQDRLPAIAELWLAEAVKPRRCGYCQGSSLLFSQESKRHVDCPHCGANGIRGWSERKRAQWVGMSEGAWRQTWASRYEQLGRIMAAKEDAGLRIVARAIG